MSHFYRWGRRALFHCAFGSLLSTRPIPALLGRGRTFKGNVDLSADRVDDMYGINHIHACIDARALGNCFSLGGGFSSYRG